MISSSSSPFQHQNSSPSQDRSRPKFNTSYPSGSSSNHNLNNGVSFGQSSWNHPVSANMSNSSLGGVGSSLNDSLGQSRPHYQSGYLLSLAQGQPASPSGQRYEDAPLIPTKAKLNQAFPRGSSSDFGSESIFESSLHRHRDAFDENGPPRGSVNDIMDEVHSETYTLRSKPLSASRPLTTTPNNTSVPPKTHHPVLYVIVFGYPPTRYSSTVAFFKTLADGGFTEIEQSNDVENAFRIGFKQPWDAARACRKNGEIISGDGGRWIVGAKWEDPQLAERTLGMIAKTPSYGSPPSDSVFALSNNIAAPSAPGIIQTQQLESSDHDRGTPIGTPIKLAPSNTAYKKTNAGGQKPNINSTNVVNIQNTKSGSPAKGIVGQVSDLIFGW